MTKKYYFRWDKTSGNSNPDGCVATYEFKTCPKGKGCKYDTYTVDGRTFMSKKAAQAYSAYRVYLKANGKTKA